jgi:hypothetical protein
MTHRILLPGEVRDEERRTARNALLCLLVSAACLLYVVAHVAVWWLR